MTESIPTWTGTTLRYAGSEKEKVDTMFFDYLANRRRQIIAELRDIETHLLKAGRIDKSALKPVRKRN